MAEGGERGRSWYLSKEEIEQGSPSRKDGMPAAREAHLRSIYSSYIRDVGRRLGVPDITIATGTVLCHRFYLHQSLLKNEWQVPPVHGTQQWQIVSAHTTLKIP